MASYVTYSNMCCQKLFKYLTHPTILSSCFLTSACSTCSSCIFFSKKARCFSSLLCQRKSDCQNQLTIRGLIKVELAVYNTTHNSVNYDRSGECRPEKDCGDIDCRFDNLSRSHHQSLMMTSAQVVETTVNVTTNSPSQDYTHPDDRNLPTYDVTPGYKPFIRIV